MQLDFEPGRTEVAGRPHLDNLAGAKHIGAKDPADRLGETPRRIFSRWVLFRKAAVPGGGAAHGAGRQAMNDIGRDRGGGRYEEKHDKAVIRTAAFSDRHNRQPWLADLHRHAIAGKACDHWRQSVDE